MSTHPDWVRQIDAELDGELTLVERAALARHLAGCAACAGARASHLELRVALARSAGEPQARTVPRPRIRGRSVAVWVMLSLLAGAAGGWLAQARWGGPGPGSLEASRAAFVVE
jgi:anti-sigma factor RsiW